MDINGLTLTDLIAAKKSWWHNPDYGPTPDDLAWALAETQRADCDPCALAERKFRHGLRGVPRRERAESYRREQALGLCLALLWAKPSGLLSSRASLQAERQIFSSADRGIVQSRNRLFDHNHFWCSRAGAFVITTHPYNVNDEYRERARTLCERFDAAVEYPKFPSWWNWCPGGGTTLVVWRAAGAAIGN
jgi:hypothetical protein